jgi:hypothetical protein
MCSSSQEIETREFLEYFERRKAVGFFSYWFDLNHYAIITTLMTIDGVEVSELFLLLQGRLTYC